MTSGEVFVCDTHPLVWFLTENPKLSASARSHLRRAEAGEATVYVPTIVLSEFLWLAKRDRVSWERFFEFLFRLEGYSGFRVADLNLETLSRMTYVIMVSPQPRPELELHDLSILATALLLGAKLITKDRQLRRQTLVEAVW